MDTNKMIRSIASEIAKREGRKSQARIGDIREIIKLLCKWESDLRILALQSPESIDGDEPQRFPLYWLNAYAESMSYKRLKKKAKK